MRQSAKAAASQIATLLRADDGVQMVAADLLVDDEQGAPPVDILELNAPVELTEKAAHVKYPAIYVYCEKLTNSLKEKFRSFSGSADVAIDVRVSHDHLYRVQEYLQVYVQSVTDVLDRNRGTWTDSMFYTGGYEIVFSPVKRGGKNYLQSAKVRLEVLINED